MTSKTFKKIITDEIAAAVEPLGFSKAGPETFYCRKSDLIHIINLQRSRDSTKESLVFTINLGIFSLPLGERLGISNEPDYWDSHWQKRLGSLLPGGDDKWWQVEDATQAKETGDAIAKLIVDIGVNALNQIDSSKKLVALWNQGIGPGLTAGQRQRFLAILGTAQE